MERRSCSLGCIVAWLGLMLSCFLLPYLVSSIYALASNLLQVSSGSTWLWGDWLNSVVGGDDTLYMVLSEGPLCCTGSLAFLIVILGLVMVISGLGRRSPEVEAFYDLEGSSFLFNPGQGLVLQANDILVVFGHQFSLFHFKDCLERDLL